MTRRAARDPARETAPGAGGSGVRGPAGSAAADRALRLVIPLVVLAVSAGYLGFGLLAAGETLGCDFAVYHDAARRYLAGEALYDTSATAAGTACDFFFYPPPFVLLVLPFSLLGLEAGTAAWIAFQLACYVTAIYVLPLPWLLRWAAFLAGAVGWPLIFGVRLGQVGPTVLLVFALAWRYIHVPGRLGTAIGLGALVKLQPGILLGWLVGRGAWRALGVATVVGLAVALGAAAVGLHGWLDLAVVLRNVSDGATSPTNVSIGASVYRLGFGEAAANAIQAVNTLVLVAVVVAAGRWLSAEAGLLVAVVSSQILSPVVWTHYAVILVLPVAWLLSRRQWWALLIPISQAWVLLPWTPLIAYTIGFYAVLAGVIVADLRTKPAPATASAAAPVAAT